MRSVRVRNVLAGSGKTGPAWLGWRCKPRLGMEWQSSHGKVGPAELVQGLAGEVRNGEIWTVGHAPMYYGRRASLRTVVFDWYW